VAVHSWHPSSVYIRRTHTLLRCVCMALTPSFFSMCVQSNLTQSIACLVIALVIINGGRLSGGTPTPQSTQTALSGRQACVRSLFPASCLHTWLTASSFCCHIGPQV
jgi:hypothetical protein